MAFHTGPWLTLIVIALICLFRAYQLGKEGMDEDGNTRNEWQYWRVRGWALAGFGLLAYAFVDWFNHFNPSPASMR